MRGIACAVLVWAKIISCTFNASHDVIFKMFFFFISTITTSLSLLNITIVFCVICFFFSNSAQERDEALLARATSNREGKLLWERLEESQKALDASRQEQLHTEHEKKQMGDLLHFKLQEAKVAHHLYMTFLSQLAKLLSNDLITVPESEEVVTERIRELCSQVKDRKNVSVTNSYSLSGYCWFKTYK